MRTRPLVALGLAAVLLAACGSDDNGESAKKGPQVADDAASALEKAGAVRLTGTETTGGKETTLDLRLQGQDATGTIGVSGEQLKIIETGGKVYIQASSGFWTQNGIPQTAVSMLAGKWVIVPASAASQFQTFSIKGLADALRHPSSGGTIKDQVTTGTLSGQKTVVVTQSDGSTLDVAATGTPYPLRTVDKGSNKGTITASDFGKKTTITAPSGALDLSQVASGGA
jgi:hypothetical protein